jgi:cell division protein FtsQ
LTLAFQIAGVAILAALALWLGYARAMASEHLKVVGISVRGNQHLSEGEVRELLGVAVGENILALDIERLKGRLTASPWVAQASVRRSLPNMVEVSIQEREPLALAELDRLYLMDASGALIEIYGPRSASFDLPIVRGLRDLDGEARADRAARAGALLHDLDDLAGEISEVSVEENGDLRVVLRGPGEVLRLGLPPYRERFALFLRLRRTLTERCPRAEYFDLRFRSRIVAMEPSSVEATPAPAEERGEGDARVAGGVNTEVIRW